MVKSLAQLKAKRNKLLKGSQVSKLKSNKKKQEILERRRLEDEIRLLENPRLASVGRGLAKFGRAAGKFLKERADIVTENMKREARAERMRTQRKSKPKSRSKAMPKKRRR